MNKSTPNLANGIAIIGMAGRFPGADSVAAFWRNLCQGVEALHVYSREEINASIADWDPPSRPYVAQGMRSPTWVPKGFRLADADKFDAGFFGYSPAEAELLDPQQRLFLECAWSALEDAGYIPDQCPGTVGVFGGATLSRYFINNVYANRDIAFSARDLTAGIGNEPDYITNRVAYKLDLKGPAISVQTACSTSLVAVHLACQSLYAGEASMCLAGGVLLNFPGGGYAYQEGSMMSPDGHIRAFDEKAQGTVFSEGGVGIVALKRYADALAGGDHIYAVILGSAVSNDGVVKAGYTAPGMRGQTQVINEALTVADISPQAIGYLEAHGTGTPLGDPIEISALTQSYGEQAERHGWCALGSLKPNVGHLASVAGVAGLIKAALVVKEGVIPPQINFQSPNPRINFSTSPFHVRSTLSRWEDNGNPRIAAVSSFGIGGTNAHVVVHQPPVVTTTREPERLRLFPLSGRTPQALAAQAVNLADYLESNPSVALRDVTHTLRVGRKPFEHRYCIATHSPEVLLEQLREFSRTGIGSERALEQTPQRVWMFSGQGAQYVGMGRGLLDALPVFKEVFFECCDRLQPELNMDLRTLVWPEAGDTETAAEALRQTCFAQPALFSFEYALAQQLLEMGLAPQAMIGHSLGEYVAACLAGVFDLNTALRLVAVRGRLMQSIPRGSMLAVAMEPAALHNELDDEVCLAAANAPNASVLSGPTHRIADVQQRMEVQGISCRSLATSHAFHSAMMQPIVDDFAAVVRRASPRVPKKPFISNVTGTWITDEQACDPRYWARHLRGTVAFAAGIDTLLGAGYTHFVEVGPGNTLVNFSRRVIAAHRSDSVALELVRHIKENRADAPFFVAALGRLWATGGADLTKVVPEPEARRISLPSYPFARERFWINPPETGENSSSTEFGKRPEIGEWFYAPSWRRLAPLAVNLRDWSGKTVLLLATSHPVFALLREALSAAAANVVVIAATGEPVPDANMVLEPADPAGYLSVVSELPSDKPVAAVVHGWDFTASTTLTSANAGEHTDRAFFSLLHLLQALVEAPLDETVALLSLTTEVADVTDSETINAAKATLLGVHLCLGYEYPNINSRNVDFLPAVLQSVAPAQLAQDILSELQHLADETQHLLTPSDKNLARRGRFRWAADYVETPQPERVAPWQSLRADAAYLITGGLGGLGLEFADYLVSHGARKIALMGRSALPPHEQWSQYVATAVPGDRRAEQLRKLLALTVKGAELRSLSCDISDAAAVKRALLELQAQWGALAGVLHCAGVAGSGVIQLKTPEAARAVLRPKLLGTLALAEALEETPLDFFVVFSSLFAVIGGIGQVDYSAANNFLDAFAREYRERRGKPMLSLNWGGWRDIGMAAAHGLSAAVPDLPRGRELTHPYLFSIREREQDRATVIGYLRIQDHWALQEHRLGGESVMPGTGLLEAIRAAFEALTGTTLPQLTNVYFLRPLRVLSGERIVLELRFTRIAGEHWGVEVWGGPEGRLVLVVNGEVTSDVPSSVDAIVPQTLLAEHGREMLDLRNAEIQIVQSDPNFLELGPRWRALRQLHIGVQSLVGELELGEMFADDTMRFGLHPALLDMATGPITGHLLTRLPLTIDGEFLPFSYNRLRLFKPLSRRFYTHVTYRSQDESAGTLEFDIVLYDIQGAPLVAIDGFTLKKVQTSGLEKRKEAAVADYLDDSVTPEEGRLAFTRVFGLPDAAQWVISPQDLPALLRKSRAAYETKRKAASTSIRQVADLAPATTSQQRTLVEIFEKVLGVAPVGIHDNFFELGGDSVLAIQIVSAAKARGLPLKPNHLFEHQSVAALAKLFEDTPQPLGACALTPWQQALLPLLDSQAEAAWTWCALPLPVGFTVADARAAYASLVAQQPILRAQLSDRDSAPCWNDLDATAVTLAVAEENSAAVTLWGRAVPHLNSARAVCAVYCGGAIPYLIIALNPLLAAGEELWTPLLEGFSTALGAAPKMAGTDAALTLYSEVPLNIARAHADWRAEQRYFEQFGRAGAKGTTASRLGTWTGSSLLPQSECETFARLHIALNVSDEDIAVAALAMALPQQQDSQCVLLTRGELLDDGEVRVPHRYAFPVAISPVETALETVRQVKDTLRQVPRGGVGYELMATGYVAEAQIAAVPPMRVALSYLGRPVPDMCPIFQCYPMLTVLPYGVAQHFSMWRDAQGWHVALAAVEEPENALDQLDAVLGALQQLAQAAADVSGPGFTRSDFLDAEASEEDLRRVLDPLA